jgi:TolB-like protein
MKKIFKETIFSFILLIILSPNSLSEIKFKEVTASGIGQSYEEALNNAFAEAISMVNGKNVQTKTIIRVLSGDPLPKEVAKDQEKGEFLVNLLLILNQPEETKKEETKLIKKKEKDKKNPDKVKYSQNYLKELIDETKGGIKSYKIIKKKINAKNGWHQIKISAEVAFFNLPKEAMRVRMAVFPFKLYEIEGDQERFQRLLDQNINDYFVQTKKFTMLDRSFIEEVAKEQKIILDGKAPAIEMAKIGNEITADFILVGSVENFNINEKVTKILSSDQEIIRNEASIYMSYRLLDVATKQINYSNTIKYKIQVSESSEKPDTEIISKTSKILGEEILFSIYPVLVEKVVNGEIYLGQGGNQFTKGEKYEIFQKGEKIIDSYTNEVIGSVETSIGLIEIVSVSTGYSKAKIFSSENNLPKIINQGKYIVRPIKQDDADKEKNFKEKKEKIKKKREEKKKNLNEEF